MNSILAIIIAVIEVLVVVVGISLIVLSIIEHRKKMARFDKEIKQMLSELAPYIRDTIT